MYNITTETLGEFLFFQGINFDIIPERVRIVFAVLFVIIMILATILNSIILYVLITKRKLWKPSNAVLSPLLWNTLILLLAILPLTLLKISFKLVRTNRDAVAIQSYLTFSYIWLHFCTVMHIALNRARIIRKNSPKLYQRYHWVDIVILIIAPIWSALAPLLMFLIYKHLGKKGFVIYTFLEFSFMSCAAIASYWVIIRKVKKSTHILKRFMQGYNFQNQQDNRLHKVKQAVNLTIGGYLLTITLFVCFCIIDVYNLYNKNFMRKNQLFVNIFRAISEMTLFLSSIINPCIYFYTQSDIQQEIKNLWLVRRILNAIQSLK